MQVGHDDRRLEAGHALDLDLLADGRVGVVEQETAPTARPSSRLLASSASASDTPEATAWVRTVGEGDELYLGDEVGLAQDLHDARKKSGIIGGNVSQTYPIQNARTAKYKHNE